MQHRLTPGKPRKKRRLQLVHDSTPGIRRTGVAIAPIERCAVNGSVRVQSHASARKQSVASTREAVDHLLSPLASRHCRRAKFKYTPASCAAAISWVAAKGNSAVELPVTIGQCVREAHISFALETIEDSV